MQYKKILFSFFLLLPFTAQPSLAQTVTPNDVQRAKSLVSKMTLDQKIDYLSGYTDFSLRPYADLGIPEVFLTDGPVGIRCHTQHSTLYPASILTASTWNRSLMEQLGRSLGEDAKQRGIGILLGPGVNIYRAPMNGRNYEYFGEDPYLASEAASAYIKGVQSRGVIATIKHFACNNQEFDRHHTNSSVDERTLHEIYLPTFEKAVKVAHVGAVMNSYNPLNGTHTTENRMLDQEILRDQWNFQGILMSDWNSLYHTLGAANYGVDLEMPKTKYFTKSAIKEAINNGQLSEKTIDRKVQHILQTLSAFGLLDHQSSINKQVKELDASAETALQLAREGVVLLKNDGNLLPFKGRLAVIGPNADKCATGGGSGNVSPFHSLSLADALKSDDKRTIVLTDDVVYKDISTEISTDEQGKDKGWNARYFDNTQLKGTPVVRQTDDAVDFDWGDGTPKGMRQKDHFSVSWEGYYQAKKDGTLLLKMGGDDGYRLAVNGKRLINRWSNHGYESRTATLSVKAGETYHLELSYYENTSNAKVRFQLLEQRRAYTDAQLKKADAVVVCVGFDNGSEGEGFDRPFAMDSLQEELIHHVASVNSHAIVVVNAGGGVDMSRWIDEVPAVIMAWYTGEAGGQALSEIIRGKCNPSGKLPISIERKWEDNPCHDSYYANDKNSESPSIIYKEGVFTGYRGYDKTGKTPLFPFGFGLSYTTFRYDQLRVSAVDSCHVKVSFRITNTGSRNGEEVAQVYVGALNPSLPRPKKELKQFAKVSLKPGQSETVTMVLGREAFRYYDPYEHHFMIEPGTYRIFVGGSSASLPLQQDVVLRGTGLAENFE